MIRILEIGLDSLNKNDLARRELQKERRLKYAKYLNSYDLILFSKQGKAIEIEPEKHNLTVYHIGGNKITAFFTCLKVCHSIIKNNKPDLISTIDPFYSGLIGTLLKRKYNMPLNVQMHTDYHNKLFWSLHPLMKRLLNISIMKFVLKNSNSIRVVSSTHKYKIEKLGFKNKLIEIIPTPVDIDIDKIEHAPDYCSKFKTDTNTKILLYVGRLEPEKDIETLLKAFSRSKEYYSNIKLLIAGMGSLLPKLTAFARKLNISDSVHFLGGINYEDIFSFYKGCDIFVISSKAEGRSTVLTEAALSKKPIVATRFTGTQDLVVDGYTGFVVDIGDYFDFSKKIIQLLNSPNMINAFGQNSYNYVTAKIKLINNIDNLIGFWEKTAKKYMNALTFLRIVKNRIVPNQIHYRRVISGICRGYYLPINLNYQFRSYLGFYETEIRSFIKEYVKPGFCCYDIGSSIGYYTIALAKLAAPGKIYSFEADIKYYDLLNNTIEFNRNITSKIFPLNYFVGYKVSAIDKQTSIDYLVYKQSLPKPDFIKMDIEGAEYEAFLGAERVLNVFHPKIIVEVHSDKLRDSCKKLIEKYGYSVHIVNQNKILPIREGEYNGWLCCEKNDD